MTEQQIEKPIGYFGIAINPDLEQKIPNLLERDVYLYLVYCAGGGDHIAHSREELVGMFDGVSDPGSIIDHLAERGLIEPLERGYRLRGLR